MNEFHCLAPANLTFLSTKFDLNEISELCTYDLDTSCHILLYLHEYDLVHLIELHAVSA